MLPTHGQAASLYLGDLPLDVATAEQMVHNRIKRTGAALLLFDEFCRAVNDLPRLTQAGQNSLAPAQMRFVKAAQRVPLSPDLDGYVRYLRTQGNLETALADPKYQRRALFHESGLIDSVLVVAPRGWGKSELLKAIIRHEVEAPNDTRPRGSVVVIDPGNNLARQVARWPELTGSNRLVYIEPGLQKGMTVGINPLDGRGLDHEGRNEAAIMLAEALDANTAPLSMNMETLIINCATVLMSRPGSTLRDLRAMLRDPDQDNQAAALYGQALTYPDLDVREFFERDFRSEGTKGSRVWLEARLQRLFADHHLASMFGGASTVDLGAAIAARKVVVVNLHPMKAETSIARAGRLLTAAIGAVIRSRDPDDPALGPVQLVIDEVTMVAGGTLAGMLAQLRKFGLNLVMGQQVMAAGWQSEDKATILQNTGSRFIGGTNRALIRDMLALGREDAELPPINHYQFWSVWKGEGPNLLHVRDDLVGHRQGVSPEEWADYVASVTDPLSGYYRASKPEAAVSQASEAHPMASTDHGPLVSGDHGSHETRNQAPNIPLPQPPERPAGSVPVEAVKLNLERPGRPGRSSRAKGVDLVAAVGAPRPKPRKKTPAKPIVEEGKAPEVKRTRRKLDDEEP